MTRRLRPPAPLQVCCGPDGQPARIRRGGRERRVTHIAACWIQPVAWWTLSSEHPDGDPCYGERTCYRVVLERTAIYELFHAGGQWYLDRVID